MKDAIQFSLLLWPFCCSQNVGSMDIIGLAHVKTKDWQLNNFFILLPSD